MSKQQSLYDVLNQCTVRIETEEQRGTGSFVAPGVVVTCAHIVKQAFLDHSPIEIIYDEKTFRAKALAEQDIFPEKYPDLALLRINLHKHPCVALGIDIAVNDKLYSFGYTQENLDGESTTIDCEGSIGRKQPLIKLKKGQIKPGSSGSPLLNERTCQVCGIIKSSRDRLTDLGGAAIPVETILTYFPGLLKRNLAYHKKDKIWQKAPLLLKQKIEHLTASISPTLYRKPGVIHRPAALFGRRKLLQRINRLLGRSRHVLLTGMAGIGKTSLAAILAEQRLKRKAGLVIWLKVEQADEASIMDALADCCDDRSEYDSKRGDSKKLELRSMIGKLKASLLVLDDVDNVPAIEKVLQLVPESMPIVMTSRQSFNADEIINVDKLEPSEALDLLGFSAGEKNFRYDPSAADLCADFEYLPYAIELCGQIMKLPNGRSPKELHEKLARNLLSLSKPGNKDQNLRALLDDWTENLEGQPLSVFLALGVFPVNGLTSSLLATYIKLPTRVVDACLDELSAYSLIGRQSETDFYTMHKLTFEYVISLQRKSKAGEKKLANAALAYLSRYSQDFNLIALDLPNLLSIADKCDPSVLVEIMSWLTLGGYPTPGPDSYFVNKGHSLAFLERFDQSIDFCRKYKLKRGILHYLIGKRGDAYFNVGDYKNAITCYEEALKLAPDKKREVVVASVAARTYAISGHKRRAAQYFKKSYMNAKELNDKLLLASIMGQESHAASVRGDFRKIKEIAERQIAIAQKIIDIHPSPEAYKQLFFAVLNHGAAEMELAKQGKGSFKTAFSNLQHAHQIALAQKSDVLLAYSFDSLGEVSHYLKKN